MEKEDNIAAATHIRNLSNQENTRALFRRIRYMERKIQNLSTTRITTHTRKGKKVELIQKEEVERCILQENERKYHQTEGTGQLQRGKILHDLGTMGEGPQAEALLNGRYAPPMGTSRHTKDFVRVMRIPPGIRPVPPFTFQEFQDGWKKAKEGTSSNGPHFGHYKASMFHPQIAKLLYKRAILPVVTGYAPRRHRQGIDVMLLKKENTYDVDRLRTIVLFDSEANMNYKHLGRRAMKAAIASGQIATEQYSRPHRKAIDHALNRRLVIDHQLYLRQPYAITSCDLKSCYDRINHTAASLTLQRIGIAKSEVITMFTSIQRMVHRVRTAFGDSTHTYGGISCDNKWTLPPQGVLQGNGCGPAIWAILSSCIFEILRQRGHCNSIKSSLRHLLIELSGFAYVDDTDLLQINDTVEEVVQYMQQKILDWNENIGVTGGVLSPSKCWWYLVTFQYIAGKWKAVSPQGDFNLWLKNESKKRVVIDRIHPSHGINMLGVHIAPDGNNRDQVQALRLKIERWVNNVRSSQANMEEVWTAMHRTIPFSVCYPLPAVTLTPEECRYIMAPITKYGLPLSGIASTTPTAVKVGSILMGGLGVIDPYIFMGTSQIENFVSNTWKKSPTGVLQEITLEDFALEMGISMPWTTEKLQKGLVYATAHSWIRQLVQFTMSHAISIEYQLTQELTPKRTRDKTIMEAAFEYTTHKPFLKSINTIRMFTNVTCLSDLATADGRKVDDRWFWPREHYPRRNLHQWPKLHHANTTDWRRWRQWLTSITRDQTKELLQPLGTWYCEQSRWITEWDSVCTLDEELLYIRISSEAGWTRHVIQPNQRRRNKRYYTEHITCREPPGDPLSLKRVSYKRTRTYIEVLSDCLPPIQWTRPDTNNTIWDPYEITHNSVLSKIQEVIEPYFLDATRELNLLFRDFSLGTIVAVSDGSYFPEKKKAAAAWIIESACGTQWIMGSLFIPGMEDSYSSYRSELTGLVAISLTLKILAGGCAQPKHVIIGCDGQSALNSLSLTKDAITSNTSNYDLLSILIDIWDPGTMKPYPVHVKGHQDNDQEFALTRMEKLNVIVDKLARLTAAEQTTRRALFKLPFLGMKTVTQHGRPLTGRLQTALYSGIVDNNLVQYLEDKFLGPSCTIDNIALPAFQHTRSTSHLGMVKFMSKWWSNTLPTGVIMQRRSHRIFNRCPRCNEWGEDRLHLIVCWDSRAKIIRKWYLDTIRHLLNKLSTHPDIINFIMEGLVAFFRSPHQRLETRYTAQWQEEQRLLGWYNFVSGFIGKTLVEKQQRHYQNIGMRNKGKRWASQIITHNWHMIYKQWLGRNEVLHQKEIINTLSGGALLDIEIEKVYDAGYEDLPTTTHKWFKIPKRQLMEKSVDYKKGWLLIVRSIRETLNISEYSIFSSSRALRKWVGLTNNRTNR